MQIIKPAKLNSGDLIGIFAPSSPLSDFQKIENAVAYFERLGYRVHVADSAYKEHGYLAGNDEERLKDLHSLFKNKDVKAIICLRGGYGAIRYLGKINYQLIRRNPKILVGFSDITTLQLAIYNKAKLITFAGPMISTFFGNDKKDKFIEEQFWQMITSTKKKIRITNPQNEKFFTLSKGSAEGRILGGNLTSMLALSGSEYLPSFRNSILLMEEVSEPPYKIDRYFSMLRLQKILHQTKGVILGRFVDCYEKNKDKKTLTLNEVINEYFESIDKPVLYNVHHGHIEENLTLPIGANCRLNASRGFIEIIENVLKKN